MANNSFNVLKISKTFSNKYKNELHIDPSNGLDTNIGSEDLPLKTINKALSLAVNDGYAFYLHSDTYEENIEWLNTDANIIGTSSSGLVQLNGNWTLNHGTGRLTVKNCSFLGNLSITSNSDVHFYNSKASTNISKSGSGNLEINDSDFTSQSFTVTGAGNVVLNSSKANPITVNNQNAIVKVNNKSAIVGPVIISGTMDVDNSEVYSISLASPAIAGQLNSTVKLKDTKCYKPDGTLAAVSLIGSYSLNNVNYDKINSNLSGINLGLVSHFDGIDSKNTVKASSISIVYDYANAYDKDVIVENTGSMYKSNDHIPAGTAFAIGTTGATWMSVGGAPGDYISVLRAGTDQTGVTANTDLVLNVVGKTSNGIAYNTSNGIFTLRAGVTYDLFASLAFDAYSSVDGYISYGWVDAITNTLLSGTARTVVTPTSRNVIESSQPYAGGFYTPSVTQTVKLRAITSSGTAELRVDASFAKVIQVAGANTVSSQVLVVINETVSIGGSTTSPTKSTLMTKDTITLIDDGSGWCNVDMELIFANAGTGATAGSGVYLITLPGGYKFDLTRHPANTSTTPGTQLPVIETTKYLPAGTGLVTTASLDLVQDATAIPHNATQFKLIVRSTAIAAGASSTSPRTLVGAGNFSIGSGTGGNSAYVVSFRFKKA